MITCIEKDNAYIIAIENPNKAEMALIRQVKELQAGDATQKRKIDDVYANLDKAKKEREQQLTLDIKELNPTGFNFMDEDDLPFM